jgi:sugar phosphate isomerase/epimerase
MLAISTVWNFKSAGNAKEALLQIKQLGLKDIELGYSLSESQLNSIIPLLKDMAIRVVSIHNFCPMPSDQETDRHPSGFYRLSSLDEDERTRAVHWTKNTIDVAESLSCPIIVLHAGTIEIADDSVSRLIDLYRNGKANSDEYTAVKEALLSSREEKKPDFMNALMTSLDEIMEYAFKKGIRVGLETRYYPNEIPNLDEIGILLERYSMKGMHYWHDVGHAEVTERLGIAQHEEFLKRYGSAMAGIHIHGVDGLNDHLGPLNGDFSLEKLKPYFTSGLIYVIESHFASFEELEHAVRRLNDFIA